MAIPRFSEILASRRRELGLTTAQASRVLKLREDVLLAFENGDYEHMPQSGYAQGMLSSYARYLGLNAREIVDLFTEELYEYQHGTSSHELRRRTRHTQSGRIISGYETPNEVESRPKAYVEYRPLLPSGGGPAGDLGDFATTAPARPRMSVPLAGAGTAAPGTRGYTGTPAREDERPGRRGPGRPYNAPSARERESSSSTARRRPPASRRRGIDQTARLDGARSYPARGARGADGAVYMRDDVSTRRVRAGEYTDDLRLDEEARPSVSAATTSGRRSSRNIANVERPNVRRRAPRAQADGSRGRRPPARGGLVGLFLSDPRRALFALILLLAVVLTAVLVFSVSSCVSARNQPATGQVVPVQSTDGTRSDDEGATDGDAASDSDEPAADDSDGKDADAADEPAEGADGTAADGAKDEEPTETVVEVSVAEGSVSWVEITCDGKSEVAESVTGPWTKSYTVEDSISIQVANPDAVTVTKNGEKVALSQRAGGLGSVKIDGTPAAKADASADEGAADEGE